jgi:hypothetical protein
MRKLTFAIAGAASLALAACQGQQDDTIEGADNVDTEELNALADNAAMDAENEALGVDVNAVEEPAENATDESAENLTDPAAVEDDVQGM